MSDWQKYEQANHYLNEGLIRREPRPEGAKPRKRREWMECFLPHLNHPEQAYPAVQVAGTSGKGSVAVMVAEILRAAGVRTGLHVTPYLQLATEKLWVDGLYASAQQLHDLVEWIKPAAEACRGPWVPMHGMASVGICLEHFRREAVEVAVMETGVGGRNDITNVLRTEVALINNVGFDHLRTLGPTLEDIARHKAGIIKPGCRAVVLDGTAKYAAVRQARQVGAALRVLSEEQYWAEPMPERDGRIFFSFQGERLRLDRVPLGMVGRFQADNAALAAACAEELDPSGERIGQEAVVQGLRRARLPGRMERLPPGDGIPCSVLMDGAHNPDKLAAMLGALTKLRHRRLHVVFGGLGHRRPDQALERLGQVAQTLVLTEPQVYAKEPRPAGEAADAIGRKIYARLFTEPQPDAALDIALNEAAPEDLVLVTGSLYLCGQLRGRFFPPERVLQERKSWW